MPDFGIYAGDTNKTIYVRLRDSTTGLGKTGLVFNSAGATCSYTLPLAARAAITLATQTVTGAHTDGGFVEVDATNCKGLYRLDLSDAAIASGDYTIISIEFDGIIEESILIPLHTRNVNVTQWLGTAAATPTVAGVPEVDVTHWLGTAAATPTTAGVPEVDCVLWQGGFFAAGVSGVPRVDVGHWGGNSIATPTIPGVPEVDVTYHVGVLASVTGGNLDVNVDGFTAGAIDAAAVATDAIDADAFASDAVTKIRSVTSGTADSGTTTTLVDAALTQADTDYWKDCSILITSGSIAGQVRRISAFTPGTDTITVSTAFTQAVGTNTYEILATDYAETPGAGSGDWTTAEKNQIRYRLQLDGTTASPAADAPNQLPIDVQNWAASAVATPTTAGVPEVDVTYHAGVLASVTGGNLDVNVDGFTAGAIDAAAIATDAIDADALASDAVTKIRSVTSGTADSGTTTTLVDAALTQADTDYWKDCSLLITSGTIAGQVRRISAFTPGTDTITVSTAFTQAVGTNTYEILATDYAETPGAGSGDWTTAEKNQIRYRLQLDGTTASPAGDAPNQLPVDVQNWDGSAVPTTTIAGVPEVDMTYHVGSLASATGGNLDVNVGSMDTGVIVAGTFAQGAVSQPITTDTAQAGTSNTITLAAGASATNDLYNGALVKIVSGVGAGQSRMIWNYSGTVKLANILPDWITAPDNTSVYEIWEADARVSMWSSAVVGLTSPGALPIVDVGSVNASGDAADNLGLFFDGTGYAAANSTIGTCTTNTDMRGTDNAALASVCTETRLAELDAANLPTDVANVQTDTTAIVADTNELQTDWANGGRLDLILDKADRTVQMTEGYAADGVAPTFEEMQFMIWSALSEFAITSTTITSKKLDGSTTAMTFTLDDATNPTSRTRTT